MIKIIFGVLTVLFILGFISSSQDSKDPIGNHDAVIINSNSSKDFTYSFKHDNTSRVYSVHVPPQKEESTKLPLVIVFHGGASNIEEVKSTLGWDKTADMKKFIVAYPQATGDEFFGKKLGIWNAGDCCNPATKNKVDDIGFIKEMIKQIESNFLVDTNKIFVTGISNGSMMAIKTSCDLSGQIMAMGTVAGTIQEDDCNLQKPVPLIYFSGTADKCVPINGGTTQGCFDLFFKELLGVNWSGDEINFDSAEGFISKWKLLNQTDQNSEIVFRKNKVDCISSGPKTKSEVVLCKVLDMGHTWPGQLNYGTNCDKGVEDAGCNATMKILGEINHDVVANEMMWDFFSKHSLTY